MTADEFKEAYDFTYKCISDHKRLKLSQVEHNVLSSAADIFHNLFLTAKYPEQKEKLDTGGSRDIYTKAS